MILLRFAWNDIMSLKKPPNFPGLSRNQSIPNAESAPVVSGKIVRCDGKGKGG